ncbi:threonine/homoserine/homoserine lactone efflux protein [Motilibacter rhizosphaerae]|uniref:Threonine/homoserine/homoserine lactone efflux protein n=1 Tax=Motilibacter rhizosphaerae TaxID=598652 RepID=A0A4Q7NUQ1_9ACTN|nr:LysE family transporter [Motilibacter rhizosphaerae]RZS90152.1 threonine/homoserine/homoserine lactone efflux protein [Motilibacter rhizosphaerae]
MGDLLLGLALGLAAGVSPGPLLVLVVTSTLRGGVRAGAAVASAPLLSDVVVVAVAVTLADALPDWWFGALGSLGAVVVGWTALQTWREARYAVLPAPGAPSTARRDLVRAAGVNLASPHPWLSWLTALGPLTVAAWRSSPPSAVALVAGFYAGLVGAKLAVSLLAAGGRRRIGDAGYRRSLRAGALLLAAAAVALAVEFVPRLL